MMNSEPSHKKDSVADHLEEIKRQRLSGNWVTVGKARRMMFWIAVLIFISEMMSMHAQYRDFDIGLFLIILVESGVFIALGLWTKKKPYTAVLTGLIIFVAMLITSSYQGYEMGFQGGLVRSLTSGALVKLIIFVTLIKAVNDARELQNANGRI